MDPDLEIYRDTIANVLTFSQNLDESREQGPAYHIHLQRVETDLDLAQGLALVYLYVEPTLAADGGFQRLATL